MLRSSPLLQVCAVSLGVLALSGLPCSGAHAGPPSATETGGGNAAHATSATGANAPTAAGSNKTLRAQSRAVTRARQAAESTAGLGARAAALATTQKQLRAALSAEQASTKRTLAALKTSVGRLAKKTGGAELSTELAAAQAKVRTVVETRKGWDRENAVLDANESELASIAERAEGLSVKASEAALEAKRLASELRQVAKDSSTEAKRAAREKSEQASTLAEKARADKDAADSAAKSAREAEASARTAKAHARKCKVAARVPTELARKRQLERAAAELAKLDAATGVVSTLIASARAAHEEAAAPKGVPFACKLPKPRGTLEDRVYDFDGFEVRVTGKPGGEYLQSRGSQSACANYPGVDFESIVCFHQSLQHCFAHSDSACLAERVRFPVSVNLPKGKRLSAKDARALQSVAGQLFAPDVRAAVLGTRAADVFCNEDGIMMGSGMFWSDGVGGKQRVYTMNLTDDMLRAYAKAARLSAAPVQTADSAACDPKKIDWKNMRHTIDGAGDLLLKSGAGEGGSDGLYVTAHLERVDYRDLNGNGRPEAYAHFAWTEQSIDLEAEIEGPTFEHSELLVYELDAACKPERIAGLRGAATLTADGVTVRDDTAGADSKVTQHYRWDGPKLVRK